jgi:cyclin-dependent kinase 7
MASKYLKGQQLGEGTWGTVFDANRRGDQLRVAIKRIKPRDVHLGVNISGLREIQYLKVVRGTNVIDLLDVFISDGILHLVLEYCPFDLERLIRDKSVLLRAQHSKTLLCMMLRGLDSCHKQFVLHRGERVFVCVCVCVYVCVCVCMCVCMYVCVCVWVGVSV